jgi:hypothetical protein
MKTITHQVGDHVYEIRIQQTDIGWTVASFRSGTRVSPNYSVTYELAMDMQHYNYEPAVEALIEVAKGDLDNRRLKDS